MLLKETNCDTKYRSF